MPPALSILLVDDDDLVRDSVTLLLEALGHAVTAAEGGEQALALLAEGLRPQVIVLDRNMPGLDGLEVLARIRRNHPALPVLLATGRIEDLPIEALAADPRLRITPKPFTVSTLNQGLTEVLGG